MMFPFRDWIAGPLVAALVALTAAPALAEDAAQIGRALAAAAQRDWPAAALQALRQTLAERVATDCPLRGAATA